MAIILNEYEWAERMIHNRDLGRKPYDTLCLVAKYYYENRYSKREIRRLLDQFLMSCNPDASLFFWSESLDKITKNVNKYPLVQIDHIPITQSELSSIKELKTSQAQRLAFTLLCVSKYWDRVSDRNNHWVNSQDKDIFSMANISASSKLQDILYGKIIQAGLVRQSKKIDNLNVQVLFQDDCQDSPVLLIKDFRNLGYQYLKYLGGPFFECEKCGATVKMADHKHYQSRKRDQHHSGRGRKQKYCTSCAAEIRMKQNVDAVMRQRYSGVVR